MDVELRERVIEDVEHTDERYSLGDDYFLEYGKSIFHIKECIGDENIAQIPRNRTDERVSIVQCISDNGRSVNTLLFELIREVRDNNVKFLGEQEIPINIRQRLNTLPKHILEIFDLYRKYKSENSS